MSPITDQHRDIVFTAVRDLYHNSDDLPFHGWHHIEFVYRKSAVFAVDLGADSNLTQVAALVA